MAFISTCVFQCSSPVKCEVCGVTRFLCLQGQPALHIHEQLLSIYESGKISIEKVREWCSKFDAGRTKIHDLPRSSRPNTAVNTDSITAIRALIQENCRITEEEIRRSLLDENYIEVSHGTVHCCSQNFRVLKGKRSMGP